MKLIKILPAVAIVCLATSCQNSGSGLSENSTQTDSLMYYLGQMNGAEYLREANRDTTMKEDSEKQAYLNGVRAGLATLKEGNDNYNRGVMQGIQMASQMLSFADQMEVTVNKPVYVNSLTSTVMGDTVPNTAAFQGEFRRLMQAIQDQKTEKDKVASRVSLKSEAEKAGLPEISDDLYGKVTEANNDSVTLKKGDEVRVIAEITKGENERVNLSLPGKGKIGNERNYPAVMSEAMEQLKSGETGEFMTTAFALLGNRAKQQGLEPTDVICLKITPTLVPKETPKED